MTDETRDDDRPARRPAPDASPHFPGGENAAPAVGSATRPGSFEGNAAAPAVGSSVPASAGAAPPHPLDGIWYLRVEGREYGPYTGYEIRDFVGEGRVDRDTQVRREHGEDWVPMHVDSSLKGILETGKPPFATGRDGASGPLSHGNGNVVVNVQSEPRPGGHAAAMGSDKSPAMAAILSLLIVGLGQLYVGRAGKGVAMFVGAVLLWTVFLGWIVNIWSIVDAYRDAKSERTLWRRYHGIAEG